MNNDNQQQPAFPCMPIQDQYNRLIAPIPGMSKLEYDLKKRLSQIEYDLKKSADYRNEIIDKLARIETKLDFITNQK